MSIYMNSLHADKKSTLSYFSGIMLNIFNGQILIAINNGPFYQSGQFCQCFCHITSSIMDILNLNLFIIHYFISLCGFFYLKKKFQQQKIKSRTIHAAAYIIRLIMSPYKFICLQQNIPDPPPSYLNAVEL